MIDKLFSRLGNRPNCHMVVLAMKGSSAFKQPGALQPSAWFKKVVK